MNNTTTRTTLTAIAAILIAATLVVGIGTFAAAHSAYAYQKKGDKGNGNGNGNTVTAQKNKQDGTQSGFDNLFEEEGQNLICTHPGNNATCVEEEGAAAQAPQPTTSLRVIKTVVCLPTDPDCSLPPTCTITVVSSSNSQTFECQSAIGNGVLLTLQPGDNFHLQIREDGTPVFTVSLNGDCVGPIAAGQHLTCTVINTEVT